MYRLGWRLFPFACHEENITISGEGVIYGQGDKVFVDDDVDGGAHECPLSVTAFRPRTTFLEDVTNLTVRDITIQDAAFWTLHMAGCHHVRCRILRYSMTSEVQIMMVLILTAVRMF